MTELTPDPQRAAACAQHLGDAIPGASHINHMPAHVWTRIGRWGDAVDASLRAWQSDQKAAKGRGLMTYPAHDLHMLVYAAAMDGQRSVALQAARGFTRLTDDSMLLALVLVRFGQFDEVGLDAAAGERHLRRRVGFRPGYAALRRGDRSARQRPPAPAARAGTLVERRRSGSIRRRRCWEPWRRSSKAKSLRAAGDAAAAIAAFEHAVSLQDTLLIDDPEPFPLAARHWLGAALLDRERFADAERVYREDLVRHPHNGWALTGLQQALRGQGKATSDVDEDLRASWARADVRISASRF